MKVSFKKALKIFKYLFLLATVVYWVTVVSDDWSFVEDNWEEQWPKYVAIWTMYYFVFMFAISLYFWAAASLIILVYHKIVLPRKQQ